MNKVLIIVVLLIVAGTGFFFLNTSDDVNENVDTAPEVLDQEPSDLIKSDNAKDEVLNFSDQNIYPEGINAKIPNDWVMYTAENPGNYVFGPEGYENLVLVTHEDGVDPTQVKVFIYPLSLDDAIKTSKKTSQMKQHRF